ncbi:MAG: C69 family dipeptidase [Ilumatobacteraceae bacterium]
MCDLLVARGTTTDDGRTLFAKNSDRPPGELQVIEFSEPRLEGITRATYLDIPGHTAPTLRAFISRPRWGWGAEHGVNIAGVAIGNATIYTTLDPRDFPDALTGMDLVRLGLERGRTAEESLSVITSCIERFGQGGSGHDPRGPRRPYWNSFLVADSTSAWVLETSGRTWMAHAVADTWALSNRVTLPEFEFHRHPRQPVEKLVDPRLESSRAVLARRPVSMLDVREHLSSHGMTSDGWDVCMHNDVQVTASSLIAALNAQGEPEVHHLRGNPCGGNWVRLRW